MPKPIQLIATESDELIVREYARSVGLELLHTCAAKLDDETIRRNFENLKHGGVFSFLPLEELHPEKHPQGHLCEVIDPLLDYMRPYHDPPNLIVGQIRWNSDVKELALQTKPYFQKLRRLFQKNWRRREEDTCYIGPEADQLVQAGEATVHLFPPDIDIKQVFIED